MLVARDLVLAACLPVLRARGYGPFRVIYLGKSATFLLLYAFPLLLVGAGDWPSPRSPVRSGYAFAAWGTGLYLYSGCVYLAAVRAGAPQTRRRRDVVADRPGRRLPP